VVKSYLSAGVDSPNTRRAYARHLTDAFGALGVIYVDELTGPLLAEYRAAVLATDLAPGSQALALAALRSFLSWSRAMGVHGLSSDTVRTALRSPRSQVLRPYNVLSDSEVGRIIAAASTARDRALLGLMLGAGLRVSEVVALDVRDVILDHDGEGLVHVRQGKGRKDRIVPLRSEVTELLRAYLAETGRALGQFGPLFRSHDRGAALRARRRLTARAVGYVVHEAAHRAGIAAKAISPHSLRHTMAIRSLRGGASVVAVSKVLGHASIATTQRYLDHLELGELRLALPVLPG
jgi:site-specific recombinase XerD